MGEFTWSQVTGNAVDDNGVVVDHTIATHNQTATLVTHNHTIGLDNDQSQSGVLQDTLVSQSLVFVGLKNVLAEVGYSKVETDIEYDCDMLGGDCEHKFDVDYTLHWKSPVSIKGYADTSSSLSHQHDPSNATHPHSFVLPESGHAHTIQDAAHSHTETTSHEHAAAANKPRPQYYTLVFIYLEGV